MPRIWPRLLRTFNSDQTLWGACTTRRAQQRFVPMAILIDETQAYKTASSQPLPNWVCASNHHQLMPRQIGAPLSE